MTTIDDVDMPRDITTIWSRIESHAGERFQQKRGGEFTYAVSGSSLTTDRANRNLPRSDFEEALHLVPLDGPGQVQHLQGPSFVYAILMDERIRQSDW